MTTLYIVRHGQSEANAAGILQGSLIDTPLSEKGQVQAKHVRDAFEKKMLHFDLVFASPLLRAAQTAAIISPKTTTIFDERLKEFDYGNWDGQKVTDIHRRFAKFFDEKRNLLPGSEKVSHGDDFASITAKLNGFLTELAAKYPTQDILIASHGFTIKLLLNAVLGISNLSSLNEPYNAGLTKIELTASTRTLVYFNRDLTE
ncbi:histidine phosphatase family protein [Liquorilactobacillus mali]|uniref:Phosphoglycerate mutase n=1 Tax=Liquorilactobacillus mali KCTC 3596 = DSM 20444 TaxID=1046596 RepID=A0A0R2E518_9LACO|nr:histidine phosphatase family protein [Liquorilactobacillus mali]KRN08725.1 phosphoglycerate mutase [Liquorilactobacillus mali KCTC 3596 = DSM 20444]MDC7953335.1 histidine phosphatase family protein [Liquorilactobacillus mali]QFQ75459.1 histidine phosphatase family protein [Liquorilactobacillus mali]